MGSVGLPLLALGVGDSDGDSQEYPAHMCVSTHIVLYFVGNIFSEEYAASIFISTLKMEASYAFQNFVSTYQIKLRYLWILS